MSIPNTPPKHSTVQNRPRIKSHEVFSSSHIRDFGVSLVKVKSDVVIIDTLKLNGSEKFLTKEPVRVIEC